MSTEPKNSGRFAKGNPGKPAGAKNHTTKLLREALRGVDRLRVHLTFVPPDRRLRDADNCIAAAKAGLDGLADALGVNDRRFVLSSELLTNGEIGGVVRVQVLQAAAADFEGRK